MLLVLAACTLCSPAIFVDDQAAELKQRVERMAAREAPLARRATLARLAELLGGPAAPAPPASAITRPVFENATPEQREQLAREFLRNVEHGGEEPADYDWFAEMRTRFDFAAGSDSPSIRARQALADLAALLKPGYDFTLPDLEGRSVSLSAAHADIAFVVFWATWCEPCQQEMPLFDRVNRTYPVFAITAETADVASAFLRERDLHLAALVDPTGETARRFGVETMPGAVIVDRQGRIRARLGRTNAAQLDEVLDRIQRWHSSFPIATPPSPAPPAARSAR